MNEEIIEKAKKFGLLVGVFTAGAALSAFVVTRQPQIGQVVLHPKTGYPNFVVRHGFSTKCYRVGDIVKITENLFQPAA